MVVEVKYFGAVAEAAGKSSESIELDQTILVSELKELLSPCKRWTDLSVFSQPQADK